MDEQEIVSAASVEVQAAAEKMGWIPPARFDAAKGKPFVDAEEYISRGETVLPIVKAENRRLKGEVVEVRTALEQTNASLAKIQKAMENIELENSVKTQKAVEAALKEAKVAFAAASEAGDHAGMAELTEQMTELQQAKKDAAVEKPKEAEAKTVELAPYFKDWMEEHPWYGVDKRKTALCQGIALELRESGDRSAGREFLEKVRTEAEKMLAPVKEAPGDDKVEGNRSSGRSAAGKQSYEAMPAEARKACDDDARNFVGPAKKYKTAAEWRAAYAQLYYQE